MRRGVAKSLSDLMTDVTLNPMAGNQPCATSTCVRGRDAGVLMGHAGDNERERELLQRERELLRRERELLNRERDLMTEYSGHNFTQVQQPGRELADCLLPEFDPSRSTGMTSVQWVRRLENIAEAYNWSFALLLTHAVAKLKGAARYWFDGVAENVNTWTQFRNQLIRSFPTSHDQADIHMELTKRRKGSHEDYETYVYVMKAIAQKGGIDDRSLIKYVLNGLQDRELARFLSLCEFTSLDEFLRRIKSYESVEERAKYVGEMTQKRSWNTNTRVPTTMDRDRRNEMGQDASNRRDVKCYRCYGRGHLAKNCEQ